MMGIQLDTVFFDSKANEENEFGVTQKPQIVIGSAEECKLEEKSTL